MISDLRPRILATLLAVSTLAACGGGGGGGAAPPPPPPPPPPPASISGKVMLGPVSGADIEISGTNGILATGATAADGSFGPITFSSSYAGPLKITAAGNSTSTWTCDFQLGCPANNRIYAPGEEVPFDGSLEAMLPVASPSQFVSVSLLSNVAAARAEQLGGFATNNINQANNDVASSLRLVLADVLTNLSIELGDDFATVDMLDIGDLPGPSGVDDQKAAVLTLLNSGLMGLARPSDSTRIFVDTFTDIAAQDSVLPVSHPNFTDPSLESFLVSFLIQGIEIFNANGKERLALDQLLLPSSLFEVVNAAFVTYDQMPHLVPASFDVSVDVDDTVIQNPIIRDIPITTSTRDPIGTPDLGVFVFPESGADWLSASVVNIASTPNLRLTADTSVLATLPNALYTSTVELYDTTGRFRRAVVDFSVVLNIAGIDVDAGFDQAAYERSSVSLSGSATDPTNVAQVAWVQTSGPTVVLTGSDLFNPVVDLPSVTADDAVQLRMDVDFTTGERRSDFVTITVVAFPNIADLVLADASLQQCVDDAASTGNLIDTGEVTSLTCAGVSDVAGLNVFANLTTLDLAGNQLTTLQPLIGLTNLQYLDISGNPTLPCDEIDQLAARLVEGTELIVDDTCQGGFNLDLAGTTFDAALDEPRNQLYVSIPDRSEIAVISLSELRVVDRLQLPGRANGIDLSIDGTRIFAALNGSNAVAVVDIDQRSVSTINLGVAVDHPTTWDVVEGEPDRLFVSANPGSGGLAYVAQVRLDQGNLATSVANNQFIRSRPALARSPDLQFVYVGSGFSPNSLYKLSLADPDAPIALEDDHGSVGGTDNLALNQSGTRIALRTGQVLRTGSFIEEGRVTGGASVGSTITDTLFVAGPNGVVELFDFTTLAATGTIDTSCDQGSTSRIVAFDADNSFALLQGSNVCIQALVSRSSPPDPFPNLRFADLALEECVIETATNLGISEPEEFTALDCSLTPKTILSIEGIERFVNLTSLNLSNSGVIDLSPLASLDALQTLTIRDANVSDASPLFGLIFLTSIDVTGNHGIPCTQLDLLVAASIAVQSDRCTETVRMELGGLGHDMVYDESGNRIFVSIPSLNRVSEIDLDTSTVTQNIFLSAQPRGIDLSVDGQTLFAALYDRGDVAVVDTSNATSVDVDISVELDDDRTWDVAEVAAGQIVVSTNPGSNGLGYIVEVLTDQGNVAQRVASNTIIRSRPVFAVSPDRRAVYVGSGFSPNSLYKLDATQAGLPVILEDEHGEVTGTDHLALSPDGSQIFLSFGQALATDTFLTIGQFPAGRSDVSSDGTRLLVGDVDTDAARVYDLATTGLAGNRPWGCDLLNLATIFEYGDGVLVLGDDLVCYSRTIPYP